MLAKKIIKILVCSSITFYIIFIFTEQFSWTILICGLAAQLLHLTILSSFPFVKFLSVQFLGAIVLLVVNHYLAFVYFNQYQHSLTEVSFCPFASKNFKNWNIHLLTDFGIFYFVPLVGAFLSFCITHSK